MDFIVQNCMLLSIVKNSSLKLDTFLSKHLEFKQLQYKLHTVQQ